MATVVLNIAYAFYVGSTFMRRVLPLRVVLAIGSVAFMIWGATIGSWTTVWWNAGFLAMSVVQIYRIVAERRGFELTDEEDLIYKSVLSELSPTDFLYVWQLGADLEVDAGTVLVSEGERPKHVFLMVQGLADVASNGVSIAKCADRTFVGEMSLISGDRASATVVAEVPSRLRVWDQDAIHGLERLRPDALRGLWRSLGRDVTAKVMRPTTRPD